MLDGDGAGVALLEPFVAVEVAFEVIAVVLGCLEFGLGGLDLLGAAAVFQLGVSGLGLPHGRQRGGDFIGPRTGQHFGQGGLGRLHLAAGLGHVGLQIGRFQLGHRLAFVDRVALVDIACNDATGNLEADGHLGGLDIAGNPQRVFAAAAESKTYQPPAARTATAAARGKTSFLDASL